MSSNPVQSVTKAFNITITTAPPSTVSIWPSNAVPGVVDGGPDSPVELGVKFRSDVAGTITGIRFYKATANTGTHVGNLWSSTGTQLATATFTDETALRVAAGELRDARRHQRQHGLCRFLSRQ